VTRPGPQVGVPRVASRGTADGSTLTIQSLTRRGEKRLHHRRITATLPGDWPQDTHVVVRVVRYGQRSMELIISTPDRDGERGPR
jgi:hypothetical protein